MAKKARRPDGLKKAPPKRSKSDETMAKAWEDRRSARAAELRSESDAASEHRRSFATTMEEEPKWVRKKAAHTERLAALIAESPGSPKVSVQIAQLQREYGAAESEKAIVIRELSRARAAYESLVGQGAGALCESCGQGIPAAALEQHIAAAERRVTIADGQIETSDSVIHNIGSRLHELNAGGGAERDAIERSIDECRAAIADCDQASGAFAKIRSKIEAADRCRDDAEKQLAAVESESNPFAG